MRKLAVVFSVLMLVCLAAPTASAASIVLFDWAFNIDGVVSSQPLVPPGFDPATGIGEWKVTAATPGLHSVVAFFDHEIDEAINTFFNEYGAVSGVPLAGQSWEIDEPGFVFGDIYANLVAGALDDSNGVPQASPDDVSMAMGWSFVLAAGETATAKFLLSETAPAGGFYLQQTDPDSGADIYFSSSIGFQGGGPVIPEPGTIALVLSGLGLVAASRFRKSA